MSILIEVLLDWYTDNKRDLSWRDTTDPYRTRIPEIVLQQTRVMQGYEYPLRFIRRFSSVETLVATSEDETLKYWQRLGYCSYVRNLYMAAKSMNGKFPASYQEVHVLRGVGDYTATTICSIVYNIPYTVVDGNVYRVLFRHWGVDTSINSTEGERLFAVLADEMLDKSQPAICNQAIMNFGAVQCAPQTPDCVFYPLASSCTALSKGLAVQLPVKRHKTKTSNHCFSHIYVRIDACTFIHKRTANGTWKNLFELSLIEMNKVLSEGEFLSSASFCLLLAGGERPEVHPVLQNVKHVLSHRAIYADFYEVALLESFRSFLGYQCIRVEDLEQHPVSCLVRVFLGKYV